LPINTEKKKAIKEAEKKAALETSTIKEASTLLPELIKQFVEGVKSSSDQETNKRSENVDDINA